MQPKVYIFRGAPASGKGTIAPEFAKQLPKPVVLIEQDKFRWGLHLIGRDIKDISEEEHHFAFKNTLLLFEEYLKSRKYNIVVEGLFTWDDQQASQGNCKNLIELAQRHNLACTCILLKANKDELIKRNAARPYGVPKEEFDMLYGKIGSKIGPEEIVIDTTNKSPKETLSDINRLTP